MRLEHLKFLMEMGFRSVERIDLVAGNVYFSNGDFLLVCNENMSCVAIHSDRTAKCLVILRDFAFGGMKDLREFVERKIK